MVKLKIGDVVVLKSGGPDMTVRFISTDGQKVQCDWFIDSQMEVSTFHEDELKLAS